MTTNTSESMTALQALIERWREQARGMTTNGGSLRAMEMMRCADELAEVAARMTADAQRDAEAQLAEMVRVGREVTAIVDGRSDYVAAQMEPANPPCEGYGSVSVGWCHVAIGTERRARKRTRGTQWPACGTLD